MPNYKGPHPHSPQETSENSYRLTKVTVQEFWKPVNQSDLQQQSNQEKATFKLVGNFVAFSFTCGPLPHSEQCDQEEAACFFIPTLGTEEAG